MKQPSRRTIRIFLDVIEKLDRYEATQRVIRGWGADISGPMPVPEVIVVMDWLKYLSNPNRTELNEIQEALDTTVIGAADTTPLQKAER